MSVSLEKNVPVSSTPVGIRNELSGDLQRMNHGALCRSTLLLANVKTNDRNALVNLIGKNDLESLAVFFEYTRPGA